MLYGKIDHIVGRKARVYFFGNSPRNTFPNSTTADVAELRRAPALSGTRVKHEEQFAKILPTPTICSKGSGYYSYYIEITRSGYTETKLVKEYQLEIPMTSGKLEPVQFLQSKQICSPPQYFQRRIISESQATIRNAPPGFKSLLGSRVELYPHQIDTIVRAFSEQPYRLMLADEVGLGKTIEAGAILKGMREIKPGARVMIVVPDSLTEQWISELWNRFFIKTQIWVPGTSNRAISRVYILPFKHVKNCYKAVLYSKNCDDLLIIDEAHKLLSKPDIYTAVFELSKASQNVLLLSATPVLRHSRENLRLLMLLDPKRYTEISDKDFLRIVDRQAVIRDRVFSMMRDLPDYFEYDLKADFIDNMEEILALTEDKKLNQLISDLRNHSDKEKNVETIRTALTYISEYHRIDKCIIRHRKDETPQAQAPRVLVDLVYTPAGAAEGFYEQECLDTSTTLFEFVFSHNKDPKIVAMCKRLFQAISSSPHAVLGIVTGRSDNMNKLFIRFFSLIDKWKAAYDKELASIDQLTSNPDRYHSKVAKLILWLEQEDPDRQKKFLVFSEYTQTALLYAIALESFYGEESTRRFFKGMDAPSRKESVETFQNTLSTRFLVCDSSGGEGRNFQNADYIVHCDLSWSPAIMEQRIGRLDRIGRSSEQEVVSVVLHADQGLENDIFDLYNNGLNVFKHSLCGMEIAFDEIQQQIDDAFVSNPISGLRTIMPSIVDYATQIEQEVERERYFDMARELDQDTTEQLEKLVDFFSQEDPDPVSQAMISWASKIGFSIKEKIMEPDDSRFINIDFNKLTDADMVRNRYILPFEPDSPKMRCTFSRKAAVAHEQLYFLAPSNKLYESIAENAIGDLASTVASLHFTDGGIIWKGFLCTWNVTYDYSKLIEKKLPPAYLSVLSRFIPISQVSVFISMETLQEEPNEEIISQLYSKINSTPVEVATADFSPEISNNEWRQILETCVQNSLLASKRMYAEQVQIDKAKDYFELQLAASTARRLHRQSDNSSNWIQSQGDIDLFLYGMRYPIFDLDSIAYITTE